MGLDRLQRTLEQIIRQQKEQEQRIMALEANKPHTTICIVENSGAQAIGDSTDTALTYDTDDYDPDDMHSTTTNTDRITVPVAGPYVIIGHADFENNAAGIRRLRITVNGTVIATTAMDGNATETALIVAGWGDLSADDIVRMTAYEDAGGDIDVSYAMLGVWRIGHT